MNLVPNARPGETHVSLLLLGKDSNSNKAPVSSPLLSYGLPYPAHDSVLRSPFSSSLTISHFSSSAAPLVSPRLEPFHRSQAAMDGEGEEEHLVEEREVEMVAFTGPRKPVYRKDVTLQYSVWWKQKIRPRATGTISSVEQPNSSLKSAKVIAGKVRGVKKMKSVQVLTFGKKRTVQECYDSDTTLSHWFACNDNQESRENKCIKTQKHSLTSSEKQMRPIREQKSNKMLKLSQKFPKDIKQNSSTQWQSKRKQAKEASSTDPLDEEKQLKRRTAGEYACEQMLIKNSREALQSAQSEFSIELTEVTKQEENSTKGKQSKIHVKFKKLKHENTEGKEDEVLTEVTETEDVRKINLKEENSQEKEVEGKNAGEQQVKNLNNENAEDEEDKTFVDKVDNENVGEMQIKMLKKQNSSDKNDKAIIRNDYRDSGESFFDQILKMVPEKTLPLEQEEKLKQRRGKKFSPKAEESVHEMEIKELKKEIAAIEARVMALESLAEVQT
ncbi:hypothetical protein C4D60_Mb06t23630 [Musa balbisiana]|uniref:Uncharacterized protein n=1 Tax=Musa balbisiana TaxID=52838 RepID=A0A4S8IQ66_MUSBA|nr:hypothetical protein C4D60_Mb06t23630 [Musa balbisiana]